MAAYLLDAQGDNINAQQIENMFKVISKNDVKIIEDLENVNYLIGIYIHFQIIPSPLLLKPLKIF